MQAPEGLAVSPDGTSLYVAALADRRDRRLRPQPRIGRRRPEAGRRGCVAPAKVHGCTLGRALSGAGSIVVSPDGRNVYSTAQLSNAVDIFRRIG